MPAQCSHGESAKLGEWVVKEGGQFHAGDMLVEVVGPVPFEYCKTRTNNLMCRRRTRSSTNTRQSGTESSRRSSYVFDHARHGCQPLNLIAASRWVFRP